MTDPSVSQSERFAALLQLEQVVRNCNSLESLGIRIVNETGRLVPSEQAILFLPGSGRGLKAQAMANLPAVDRSAPMVQWLESVAFHIRKGEKGNTVGFVASRDVPESLRREWALYCPENMAWMPLLSFRGQTGYLLLTAKQPWTNQHLVLMQHLAEVYGHALAYFHRPNGIIGWKAHPYRLGLIGFVAFIVLGLTIRIPITATAPAEIVPARPHTVASPVNGVVKEVAVEPNQSIKKGELLVIFDDTELRNQAEVTKMALKVAEEEYERARRSAFGDIESKALMAELQAQVKHKRSELQYAVDRLDQTRFTSQADGIVIGAPKDEWEGKPVVTGTKIIQIADPSQVQVRVYLPVNDAITLEKGSTIRVFLDADPLHPLAASIDWASYNPEMSPMGFYAYRVQGALRSKENPPRIGLRGSASIQGPRVSLIYSMFRKPITFLRQTTGF